MSPNTKAKTTPADETASPKVATARAKRKTQTAYVAKPGRGDAPLDTPAPPDVTPAAKESPAVARIRALQPDEIDALGVEMNLDRTPLGEIADGYARFLETLAASRPAWLATDEGRTEAERAVPEKAKANAEARAERLLAALGELLSTEAAPAFMAADDGWIPGDDDHAEYVLGFRQTSSEANAHERKRGAVENGHRRFTCSLTKRVFWLPLGGVVPILWKATGRSTDCLDVDPDLVARGPAAVARAAWDAAVEHAGRAVNEIEMALWGAHRAVQFASPAAVPSAPAEWTYRTPKADEIRAHVKARGEAKTG